MGDGLLTDPGPALGGTRGRVLEVLRAAAGPLGVQDVAARVELHPNTARYHLDALADAGLAERETDGRGQAVGRPRVVYRAAGAATGRRSYRLLAEMLTGLIAARVPQPEQAGLEAGRTWGRFLGEKSPPWHEVDAEEGTRRLMRVLTDAGFEPEYAASEPPPAQPSSAESAASGAAGTRSVASRSAVPEATGTQPAAPESGGARSAPSRSAVPESGGGQSAASRSAVSEATGARSVAPRSAAAESVAAHSTMSEGAGAQSAVPEGAEAESGGALSAASQSAARATGAGRGAARRVVIRLRHCPFREIAERHPKIVCALHLGMIQGVLAEARAPITAERLEPFVEPSLCLTHLSAAGGPPPTAAA